MTNAELLPHGLEVMTSYTVANFLKIEHTLALEGEVTAKRLKEILI